MSTEGIWDGDDEAELGLGEEYDTNVKSTGRPLTARERDAQWTAGASEGGSGATAAAATPDTIRIPFSASYEGADVVGKSELEFSVKNGSLNEKPSYSTGDFQNPELKDLAFDQVISSRFTSFRSNATPQAGYYHVEMANIKAPKRVSFGATASTNSSSSSSSSSDSANEPVRFTAKPNANNPGEGYKRESNPYIEAFLDEHPNIDKAHLEMSFARFEPKKETHIHFKSPVLYMLHKDTVEKLTKSADPEWMVHKGPHEEIVAAANDVLELQKDHAVYSHVTDSNGWTFKLSIPTEKVYDKKIDKQVARQPTFDELLLDANNKGKLQQIAARRDPKALAEAKQAVSTQRITYDGILEIKFLKRAPKVEYQ